MASSKLMEEKGGKIVQHPRIIQLKRNNQEKKNKTLQKQVSNKQLKLSYSFTALPVSAAVHEKSTISTEVKKEMKGLQITQSVVKTNNKLPLLASSFKLDEDDSLPLQIGNNSFSMLDKIYHKRANTRHNRKSSYEKKLQEYMQERRST